jgi:hypothetical protein
VELVVVVGALGEVVVRDLNEEEEDVDVIEKRGGGDHIYIITLCSMFAG